MTTNFNYTPFDPPAGTWKPAVYTSSGTNSAFRAMDAADLNKKVNEAQALANTATTKSYVTAMEVDKLKQENAEQRELINILTEGLSDVRAEMEGITDGVRQLVGERDYWKEIAGNLEVQRRALLEAEDDQFGMTD